jgi:hypothetical protein
MMLDASSTAAFNWWVGYSDITTSTAHEYHSMIFSPNLSGLDLSSQPVQCTPTAINGHASSSITLEFPRDPD